MSSQTKLPPACCSGTKATFSPSAALLNSIDHHRLPGSKQPPAPPHLLCLPHMLSLLLRPHSLLLRPLRLAVLLQHGCHALTVPLMLCPLRLRLLRLLLQLPQPLLRALRLCRRLVCHLPLQPLLEQ